MPFWQWWDPTWSITYVDDGDRALECLWSVKGVILLEDIHEGMLPLAYILHWDYFQS
jgi:hypothetical protein